jgi:hypothetical protein
MIEHTKRKRPAIEPAAFSIAMNNRAERYA